MNVKAKCPVCSALKDIREAARIMTWETHADKTNRFVPMCAVKLIRKELESLCKQLIIKSWKLDVTEDTNVTFNVSVRVNHVVNGVMRTTEEHWRLW